LKIEKKKILDFFEKVRMSHLTECVLSFKDDGLHIKAMTNSNAAGVDAVLKKTAFDEYSAVGNAGVDDYKNLIKVIRSMDSTLEFNIEGNLLIAKGNRKELKYELTDEKFLKVPEKLPSVTPETSFNITAKRFNLFIKDAEINKDCEITVETVDGGVKLSNTGKYKFTYNIDSKDTKSGSSARFGEPLVSVVKDIGDGKLVCDIATDNPLVMHLNTDDYDIKYLVAPRG